MKKETRINVRATEELKERLKRVSEITGINETNLVVSCVEALAEYFEKNGELTLPLAVVPKSKMAGSDLTARKTA